MLYWFVLIPILTAVLIYLFPFGKAAAIFIQALLVAFGTHIFFLCKNSGDIIETVGGYESILGVNLKVDSISAVFLILTAFLFMIVAIYNLHESYNKLFWFLFFIWQGLLNGIFLTNDIFNIFVLLEVATVTVSVLIMFRRGKQEMIDGMIYLMVNTIAIQFYLFGIGYIYKLTGVMDMDAATAALANYDKQSLLLPYALIMTGISLKCSLVPLHTLLPKAHGTPGAPTAVSALLSGLHVKCGLYMFFRFQNIFQTIDSAQFFLIIGIVTGVFGFVLALSQSDIKLILAYHTISQIGMIMIGLNSKSIYSFTGGVYHIINHALFKSALFLTAGIIIKVYGTRNIYEIRGVLKRMPSIGAAVILAIMGIIGAPFFNGSISKYLISSGSDKLVEYAILFINLGTIISFIKYSTMLLGKNDAEPVKIDIYKKTAIYTLVTLCFLGGIFGQQMIEFLFGVKVSINAAGYLQKTAYFAVSLVLGYFIFNFYVKTSKLLKKIRETRLSFNGICVSIGLFFAAVLTAGYFF